MIFVQCRRLWIFSLALASLGGCADEQGDRRANTDNDAVRAAALERGMVGDPADGLSAIRPSEDPMVELGRVLFFSRSLGGRMEVACASCHHPELAGGDGLSLSVGVAAQRPEVIGPGRAINPERDLSPKADGGPNVSRNSPTIFNSALYKRALFHDGRVFVMDKEDATKTIRTPDSGNLADPHSGDDLLEAQARFPLSSNDEMRGYAHPGMATPTAYRQYLVERLRGNIDQQHMAAGAANRWRDLFANAFSNSNEEKIISLPRIQKALAAYQRSMIFVDNPWRKFLQGDDEALSSEARQGALLFLKSKNDGGLGCASCHSGDHFTNEQFYNTGFPQIGRGKRTNGSDHGRADVNLTTQRAENEYAFRVPGLLNVSLTMPYGHAGTFSSLEGVIRYHAHPREAVNHFDFNLQHLPEDVRPGGSRKGTDLYPDAEALTRATINAPSHDIAERKLPGRELTDQEVKHLSAFLNALTDSCAADPACVSPWIANPETDNPDGNLLVRGEPFKVAPGKDAAEKKTPGSVEMSFGRNAGDPYPPKIELNFPNLPELSGFPDARSCETDPASVANQNTSRFIRKDKELGLNGTHGFRATTWLANAGLDSFAIDETLYAGGVTAAYLTDDCWLDLLFTGGDGPEASGVVFYQNKSEQNGFMAREDIFSPDLAGPFTSVSIADINGDYRRELLFANLHQGEIPIYSKNGKGGYSPAGRLPMGRGTSGIAFGDASGNGYPDMYLAHWSASGLPGTAPAFWRNDGGSRLIPDDEAAGTTENVITQNRNLSPAFSDLDGDGYQDLAIASDFNTSVVMQNDGNGRFSDVSDRRVMDDKNGMGSAVADFDNDGRLDWFISSIEWEEREKDGNRLYWNRSEPGTIRFESHREQDGIKDGGWGWAVCAADFNNDGWQDILHVNGFGKVPDSLNGGPMARYIEEYLPYRKEFADTPPRLFINNGDGTFTEQASDWGLDKPSEGRGMTCFDYDRDGDIDIALVDHSVGIQFFENQTGHGPGRRFLNVRLTGNAPNTDALGARVTVSADINGDGTTETLTRVVAANSNYASQNPTDLHFGLGTASRIEQLSVTWPGGRNEACGEIAVNRFLIIEEQSSGINCPSP